MQSLMNTPLFDISTFRIDPTLPGNERLRVFTEAVGTPCQFRVGETPVTVVYEDGAPNLQAALTSLCQSLQ